MLDHCLDVTAGGTQKTIEKHRSGLRRSRVRSRRLLALLEDSNPVTRGSSFGHYRHLWIGRILPVRRRRELDRQNHGRFRVRGCDGCGSGAGRWDVELARQSLR